MGSIRRPMSAPIVGRLIVGRLTFVSTSYVCMNMVRPCPHPFCGQTFSTTSSLAIHERTVHQGLRPFVCPQCDQTFAYKHVLKRHRALIHGRSSPPQAPDPSPAEFAPEHEVAVPTRQRADESKARAPGKRH